MKTPFILTFGSCGWDRIFYKNDSNSEPTLIYEEEGRKNSHQALAAKRAGANSMLISFVGDDEIGGKVLKSLNDCGLDTRFVKTIKGESTEVNHQFIDPVTKDYELKRFPSPLSQYYTPQMVEEYKDYILNADAVILVSKQNKDFLEEAINFCYKNNIPTTLTASHKKFDINNPQDFSVLKKVTFIAVNMQEAKDLTNLIEPADMLNLLPNLIITDGGKGVYFVNENNKITHEPAVKTKNIVETNGAGDTFIGNVIVSYVNGWALTDCIRFGQCASSLEIQKMGVLNAIPKYKETKALYDSYYSKNQKGK